jgi:hypothetical protein
MIVAALENGNDTGVATDTVVGASRSSTATVTATFAAPFARAVHVPGNARVHTVDDKLG